MTEPRTTINLNIPAPAEEREVYRLASPSGGLLVRQDVRQDPRQQAWDRWYDTLPADLRRKLSLHDFRRLGDCFKQAFGINEILPPPTNIDRSKTR